MNPLPAPALPVLLLALLLTTGLAQADRTLYAKAAAHPRLLCTAAELDAVRGRLDQGVEALAYRGMASGPARLGSPDPLAY